MAELLIKDRQHWTETASEEEKKKWTPHEKDKFAGVYRVGDIVEIRPDGYWTTPGKSPGFNKKAFGLLVIPGVPIKEVEFLLTKGKIKNKRGKEYHLKRKYTLNSTALNFKSALNKTIELSNVPIADIVNKELG